MSLPVPSLLSLAYLTVRSVFEDRDLREAGYGDVLAAARRHMLREFAHYEQTAGRCDECDEEWPPCGRLLGRGALDDRLVWRCADKAGCLQRRKAVFCQTPYQLPAPRPEVVLRVCDLCKLSWHPRTGRHLMPLGTRFVHVDGCPAVDYPRFSAYYH